MALNKRSSAISSIIVTLIAFGNVEGVRAQSANVEALKAQVRERNQRNLEAKRQAQKRQADAESAALAARISQQQREQAAAAATLKREQAAAAAVEAASAAKDLARMLKISKMTKEEYDAFIASEKEDRNNRAIADLKKEISVWVKNNGRPNIDNLTLADIESSPWIHNIVKSKINNFDNIMSHMNNDYKKSRKLRDITGMPDLLNDIQFGLDQFFNENRNFVKGSVETVYQKYIKTEFKVMCKDNSIEDYSDKKPLCVGHGGYLSIMSGDKINAYNQLVEDSFFALVGYPEHSIENPIWLRGPQANDFSDVYPKAAQWSGIEGETAIVCIVSTGGNLKKCRVLGSDHRCADWNTNDFLKYCSSINPRDYYDFGSAALKVTQRWTITPLVFEGNLVESRWKAVIRWSIVGPISGQ